MTLPERPKLRWRFCVHLKTIFVVCVTLIYVCLGKGSSIYSRERLRRSKMLPLDYPPCWEFPLRKNKMHPRGCASNVKERWKNLRHWANAWKTFVRKRSSHWSTKRIDLIVSSSRKPASLREHAPIPWSASSWICDSIRALSRQTTSVAFFGYLKPWSWRYEQTIGTSWKINDFPQLVGRTENTSLWHHSAG